MTDLRKAAEMALEALEGALSDDQPYIEKSKKAAEALRQALAQPEQEPVNVVKVEHDKQVKLAQAYERGWNAALAHGQEPVAWMSDHDVDFKKSSFGTYPCVPLYTAPPKRQWIGLTDEEKEKYVVAYFVDKYDRETAVTLMDDYEAVLKEKNT